MSQKIIIPQYSRSIVEEDNLRFFTETIEVGRISPLAFLEAGNVDYKNEHFYWQNANQTLTLVGLGHAKVLSSEGKTMASQIFRSSGKSYVVFLLKKRKTLRLSYLAGFLFSNAKVKKILRWNAFPTAFFVVPSFQLMSKNGQTTVTINLITGNENANDEFEVLRLERDG